MLSSSDRGQTEPLAALVAVVALGVGLSIYVGVLDSTLTSLAGGDDMAPIAAETLVAEASSFGVVQPPLGAAVDAARPNGHAMNVTLQANSGTWVEGPARTDVADCVKRMVSVRTAPGTVRPGTVEVCVWPER
ncbi:MAG: DUF7285 family protein [Halobacteriota archaeon]|uniref:DUF7285 family protein n=1 Tax=Natronomonas sp. TaxID=2184060 RepID=UPI0039758A56